MRGTWEWADPLSLGENRRLTKKNAAQKAALQPRQQADQPCCSNPQIRAGVIGI